MNFFRALLLAVTFVVFMCAVISAGPDYSGFFQRGTVLVCAVLLMAVVLRFGLDAIPLFPDRSSRKRRHQRYQKTAQRVLSRLKELNDDGQRLVYLRKINPYVLEELLLTAFERQGHTVIRSPSYSGDGGIDGQVIIDGVTWLIQAKRYGRSINPQHVQAFIRLLVSRNQPGFFIHTGRTGPASRTLSRDCARLRIISGQQLLDLLAGHALPGLTLCKTH